MTSTKLTLVAQLVKNLRTRVNPWLFHFNVWQNPLQKKKKKNLRAMGETCVLFLDWEDPLEKGTATHSSKTLLHKSSERFSLVSGPGLNLSPLEAKNPGVLWFSNNLSRFPEEGNGYPLQYSGLENSMECIVTGS